MRKTPRHNAIAQSHPRARTSQTKSLSSRLVSSVRDPVAPPCSFRARAQPPILVSTHISSIKHRTTHPSRSSHARTTRRRRIRSDKCRVYGTSLFKAEAQSELGLRFNHHRDCRRRIARSPRNLAPTRSSASASSYPSIARRRTSASAATATRTASFSRMPTMAAAAAPVRSDV